MIIDDDNKVFLALVVQPIPKKLGPPKPSKATAVKVGASISAGSSIGKSNVSSLGANSPPPRNHNQPTTLLSSASNAHTQSGPTHATGTARSAASVPSTQFHSTMPTSRLHSLSRAHATPIRMPPSRRQTPQLRNQNDFDLNDLVTFTDNDGEAFVFGNKEETTTADPSTVSSEQQPEKKRERTLRDYCNDDSNELVSATFRKMHNESRKKRKLNTGQTSSGTSMGNVTSSSEDATATTEPVGPQVQLVNGRIVVSQESLTAPTTHESRSTQDFEEIDEQTTRRVTSKSFSVQSKSQKWSNEETSVFYEALQICGTNFSMIASLFPNRTRKQVKSKYLREEKQHPQLVDAALKSSVKMSK